MSYRVKLGVYSLKVLLILFLLPFEGKSQNDTTYTVKGIDISKWQGKVDWEKVKTRGISFVFVKATQGKILEDERFQQNWIALKQAKIIRGAYHFYVPQRKGKEQAKFFSKVVNWEMGDLPPVLDLEPKKEFINETLFRQVDKFLRKVERKMKVKPIIYCSDNFYQDYLKGRYEGYNFWIARYKRVLPKSSHWTFWQYTDTGLINGIEGYVDFNYFKGTIEEFYQFLYSNVRKR